MSLNSLGISSKGQTPRFNTPGFVQGVEAKLDEHRKTIIMFKQALKYSVQMTNIFLRLVDLQIENKQIIEEKDRSIQNLQGTLEKEQKFKTELQDRNSENSKILVELQVAKQKIDNIQKQNKDLENIKMERDSLHATLKETYANYQGLKAKKNTLSIKHNRLHRDCKNTKEII